MTRLWEWVLPAAFLVLVGCGTTDDDSDATEAMAAESEISKPASEQMSSGPIDITGAELTNRSAQCADYANTYTSVANDAQQGAEFMGTLTISVEGETCVFTSNSIPNHDFGDGGSRFATPAAEVETVFEIPTNPVFAATPTPITLEYDNAIFLNGVKLDLLAAACYGVGNEPLGQEFIGCFSSDVPWRYDPMFPGGRFGTDSHNAHTQPNGAYHYHGNPIALFDESDPSGPSPVIGFAADGFPIYGPFIADGNALRKVESGYVLKEGSRVSQSGEGAFPGGAFDGTYRDDYEFAGVGDLDECNGMTRDGVYGYYVTDSFPWVLNCFKGTPDPSFRKGRP